LKRVDRKLKDNKDNNGKASSRAKAMETIEYAIGLGGWLGIACIISLSIQGSVDAAFLVFVPFVTIFAIFLMANVVKALIYAIGVILGIMLRPDIFLVAFTVFMGGLLVFTVHHTIVMTHIPLEGVD